MYYKIILTIILLNGYIVAHNSEKEFLFQKNDSLLIYNPLTDSLSLLSTKYMDVSRISYSEMTLAIDYSKVKIIPLANYSRDTGKLMFGHLEKRQDGYLLNEDISFDNYGFDPIGEFTVSPNGQYIAFARWKRNNSKFLFIYDIVNKLLSELPYNGDIIQWNHNSESIYLLNESVITDCSINCIHIDTLLVDVPQSSEEFIINKESVFCICSDDKAWKVIDLLSNRTIIESEKRISNLKISPDNKKIIFTKSKTITAFDETISYEGIVNCYDIKSGEIIFAFDLLDLKIWSPMDMQNLDGFFGLDYLFDPDVKSIYLIVPGGADNMSGIYKISLDTKERKMILKMNNISGYYLNSSLSR